MLRCTLCAGDLEVASEVLRCVSCGALFPIHDGFPDFRSAADSPDQASLAREIRARYSTSTYEELIEFHYRWIHEVQDPGAHRGKVAQWRLDRAHYLASIDRFGDFHLQGALDERRRLSTEAIRMGSVLDIGCGWGRDLLALARSFRLAVGIDIETHSLMYARKLLEERGVAAGAGLVLAEAEHLPFRDGSFDFVNASAVIEHVQSDRAMTLEAYRVLRVGGWYHFYYPNRFSLLPETHTGIWGLGFLPRRMQIKCARRARGMDFGGTHLSSVFAMKRLMRSCFDRGGTRIAGVTRGTQERALSSKYASLIGRRRLMWLFRLYHILERIPGPADLAFFFLPIHYVTSRKGGKGIHPARGGGGSTPR